MRLFLRSGQNLLEYGVFLALIIASLMIMQIYIKRGYQGRLKQEADQVGQQYAPKHTHSLTNVTTRSSTVSYVGGETDDGKEIPPGVSVSFTNSTTTSERKEAVDAYATE